MNSYTSENLLMIHKLKCKNYEIPTIRNSPKSNLHWKSFFHRYLLFFGTYADFEADNEFDNSSIGNKTTDIYKQSLILNGYHIAPELEDVLQSS